MRRGFLAEAITGGQFDINPLNVERAIVSQLTSPVQVGTWLWRTHSLLQIYLRYVIVIWGVLIVIWEQLQSSKYKGKMDWNKCCKGS